MRVLACDTVSERGALARRKKVRLTLELSSLLSRKCKFLRWPSSLFVCISVDDREPGSRVHESRSLYISEVREKFRDATSMPTSLGT